MAVGEDADVIEAHGGDERQQLLHVGLGLTGEADDERGAERDVGHLRPDVAEQPFVGGPGAGALHALQHRVGGVLQGQIDIAHDLGARGDGVDGGVGDGGGVEIEQAYPLDAVHLVERADQARQGIALLAVDAVERRVLRHEQQLFDAPRRQPVRFVDHRLDAAATIVAAHLRDHAEGAFVVAALGDLHVGVVTRRGEAPRRGGVVEVGGQVDAKDRGRCARCFCHFRGPVQFRDPSPETRAPHGIAAIEGERRRARHAWRRAWGNRREDIGHVAGA